MPFAPTDIAGCKLWLDASQLALADNDPIGTSWPDESGNGNNGTIASGSFQPIFKTSQINGLPAVRFAGSDTFTMTFANFMSSFTAGTIFCVQIVTASASVFFNNWNTDGDTELYPFGDGNIYIGTGSTTRKSCGAPITSLQSYHIFNVITASGAWSLRLNDSVQFSTGSNTVGWNTAPGIGLNQARADIAEVILYDSALGSTDRTSVYNYLFAKYFGSPPTGRLSRVASLDGLGGSGQQAFNPSLAGV